MRSELDWNEDRTQFRAVIYRGGEVVDVTPWMAPERRCYLSPLRVLGVLGPWDVLGLWSVMGLVLWIAGVVVNR